MVNLASTPDGAPYAFDRGLAKITLGTGASVHKTTESPGEIRATSVRTTTGGAGRRPTVMLAPVLTTEQRRAVRVFDLEQAW